MTVQINSNYLEKYAEEYASIVCERYYSGKQFITGQDIIQLTSSIQVNFFVIKRLFELWQEELNKLKSNPYFDYRDISVHEALTQFMNVLSRRIKVEKGHLQPLVKYALMQSVQVATDPVSFYQKEIEKAPSGKINEYLKENKKYYKWNTQVISFLIDKAGFGHDESAYKRAIAANYQVISENLESVNLLIATLGDVKVFDLDAYLIQNDAPGNLGKEPEQELSNKEEHSFFDEVEKETSPSPEKPKTEIKEEPKVVVTMERPAPKSASSSISSSELKHRFSAETYRGMKGVIGELSEGLAINQRFMFTKELFDGNADLLNHALKSIDNCNSFDQAIELINQRYVNELGWEGSSEEVQEFLQLVYRRFLD